MILCDNICWVEVDVIGSVGCHKCCSKQCCVEVVLWGSVWDVWDAGRSVSNWEEVEGGHTGHTVTQSPPAHQQSAPAPSHGHNHRVLSQAYILIRTGPGYQKWAFHIISPMSKIVHTTQINEFVCNICIFTINDAFSAINNQKVQFLVTCSIIKMHFQARIQNLNSSYLQIP